MSVLIKDMEIPKSCKSCDLLQDYDGDMYYPFNDYWNFGDIENVPDYVMIGCPLSALLEIIVCGDCKHYICHDRRCGYWNHGVKPLEWCCHGERRTDGID